MFGIAKKAIEEAYNNGLFWVSKSNRGGVYFEHKTLAEFNDYNKLAWAYGNKVSMIYPYDFRLFEKCIKKRIKNPEFEEFRIGTIVEEWIWVDRVEYKKGGILELRKESIKITKNIAKIVFVHNIMQKLNDVGIKVGKGEASPYILFKIKDGKGIINMDLDKLFRAHLNALKIAEKNYKILKQNIDEEVDDKIKEFTINPSKFIV